MERERSAAGANEARQQPAVHESSASVEGFGPVGRVGDEEDERRSGCAGLSGGVGDERAGEATPSMRSRGVHVLDLRHLRLTVELAARRNLPIGELDGETPLVDDGGDERVA